MSLYFTLFLTVDIEQDKEREALRSNTVEMNIEQLQNWTSGEGHKPMQVNWTEYFTLMFEDVENVTLDLEKETIMVTNPQYLRNLFILLSVTPNKVLELTLWWQVVNMLAPLTNSDLRSLEQRYMEKATGSPNTESRSMFCTNTVTKLLGMAASYFIADPPSMKDIISKVTDMMVKIKWAFTSLVRSAEWMDKDTQQMTIEKADALKLFVGYPDWLLNAEMLEEYYGGRKLVKKVDVKSSFRCFRKSKMFKLEMLQIDMNETSYLFNIIEVKQLIATYMLSMLKTLNTEDELVPCTRYDGWINFENETQDRQEWRNAICEREGKDSGFSYDLLDGARKTFRGMVLRDQPGEYCRRNGRTHYEHVVVSAPNWNIDPVEVNAVNSIEVNSICAAERKARHTVGLNKISFSSSISLYLQYYRDWRPCNRYICHDILYFDLGRMEIRLEVSGKNSEWNPITCFITYPTFSLFGYFYDCKSLEYGAVGSLLGHELSHGFDSSGIHYDKHGNVRRWWSNSTMEKYVNRTACFIEQYDGYQLEKTESRASIRKYYYCKYLILVGCVVDGNMTVTENVADNVGLRGALKAYERFQEQNEPEPKLPGFEEFSDEQLFFLSFAFNIGFTQILHQ
ncbi:hypothetical protein ANN_20475 [Periplaneta americana]|uniref:Uncharacterized protein n=1 Tax=Periplaneta americana TaxID=6978 RepID=A0ABQ8SDD5_PERAM|nr:hypothetical protein ANN_20475 [Periplaneta americana]